MSNHRPRLAWSSGLGKHLLLRPPINFSNPLWCKSALVQKHWSSSGIRYPSASRQSLQVESVHLGLGLGRAPARFNPVHKHSKAHKIVHKVFSMLLRFVYECKLETYLTILFIAQLLTVEIEHAPSHFQRQTSISASVQSSYKEEKYFVFPYNSLFIRLSHTEKVVLSVTRQKCHFLSPLPPIPQHS